jgi:hypothetical protein
MRRKNYRQGMDRHDWPDIETASLDYLISEGVEITTRGEMASVTEPLSKAPLSSRESL